jgi:drug/metabolite transporter (DMT)-like permease
MHWSRIVGIALLVGGVILLFMGWSATDSLTEEIHETFTGRFTDNTTALLVGGGVAVAVGVVLLLFGAKR